MSYFGPLDFYHMNSAPIGKREREEGMNEMEGRKQSRFHLH